jgi:hypothetical protein
MTATSTTLGNRTAGPSYLAGFVWTPTSRTSIDARFGHSYLGRTGSLMAVQRNRHLVSRVTYTDQVTTTRAQFLLPAAIDTAAMLDRLFSSTIPDPIERAQAVQAYMAATGLPPSLANNINYLSNRYMREKRLQAAYIYKHAAQRDVAGGVPVRAHRAVAAAERQRTAGQPADVAERQRAPERRRRQLRLPPVGAQPVTAGASASRSTSIGTGIDMPSHTLRLGYTRQFDRKTRAIVELRHTVNMGGAPSTSTVALGPGSYTENAMTATLSVQL